MPRNPIAAALMSKMNYSKAEEYRQRLPRELNHEDVFTLITGLNKEELLEGISQIVDDNGIVVLNKCARGAG